MQKVRGVFLTIGSRFYLMFEIFRQTFPNVTEIPVLFFIGDYNQTPVPISIDEVQEAGQEIQERSRGSLNPLLDWEWLSEEYPNLVFLPYLR